MVINQEHLSFFLLSGAPSYTSAKEILTVHTSFNKAQDSKPVKILCCNFIDGKKCGGSKFLSHWHTTVHRKDWRNIIQRDKAINNYKTLVFCYQNCSDLL